MSPEESSSSRRTPPRVFVSYAHESPAHNRWVKTLVKDLRGRGVDALFDEWRVPLGGDFTVFMDSIRSCDRVLLICTPTYARKADEGAGGVGYERQIITAELARTITTTTFVCVLRAGDADEAIPTFARARRYIDFREDKGYEPRLEELLRDLHGVPLEPEPPIGPNPFAGPVPASVRPAAPQPSSVQMDVALDLGHGVSLELVRIPAGESLMGSPESEEDRHASESPQHRVHFREPFYLGKYPVTQAQWRAVMRDNPARFKGHDRPVERVSWDQCRQFCEKLKKRVGRETRLPSEAEWEYACRAGTTTPFYFGDTISTDQANYDGNYTYSRGSEGVYREETTTVGTFPANAFGLFDMHGNVWEWCADAWHDDYRGAPSDGSAWAVGGDEGSRVLRGGSWYGSPGLCRAAVRYRYTPDYRYSNVGFRVSSGT